MCVVGYAGIVGVVAATLMLEGLLVPAQPHMRSLNPHVVASLEAASKRAEPQTSFAKACSPVGNAVWDQKLTAGISSFAFQVGSVHG